MIFFQNQTKQLNNKDEYAMYYIQQQIEGFRTFYDNLPNWEQKNVLGTTMSRISNIQSVEEWKQSEDVKRFKQNTKQWMNEKELDKLLIPKTLNEIIGFYCVLCYDDMSYAKDFVEAKLESLQVNKNLLSFGEIKKYEKCCKEINHLCEIEQKVEPIANENKENDYDIQLK